jgi:hypothetical protein
VQIEQFGADQIHGGVEVLEVLGGDGVWHIQRWPPMSNVQCSMLQNTTKHSCATRIITKPTSIGAPTPTYLGLWS